jgi:hypothetical protein
MGISILPIVGLRNFSQDRVVNKPRNSIEEFVSAGGKNLKRRRMHD